MRLKNEVTKWVLRQPRWRLALALGLALVAGYFVFRHRAPETSGMTFTVRRGPLDIHILEGGSIEALESQEIRSEIKGFQGTKILKIVDEGYLVTEQDVKHGKVLVELDSSDIRQRIITEEIQFQSTLAALTEAQQAHDIQLNQNITDIKAAEQKAKFARMDFEKYMGEQVAREILARVDMLAEPWTNTTAVELASGRVPMPDGFVNGKLLVSSNSRSLDALLAAMVRSGSSNSEPLVPPNPLSLGSPNSGADAPPTSPAAFSNAIAQIDFSKYADAKLLADGAANQELRKFQDDRLMSVTELKQAQTKFEGTRRLADKQFVTKIELDNDKIAVDKADLKQKTAQTALDLLIKYEFPKLAEETLSKYEEALRALERTRKEAISKLAQAQAKLRSAEGRFKIESAQRDDLYDQLNKCLLRAQKPGLVVYAAPSDHWNASEAIREGATVRERQRIITIPDMTQMAVRIKVHESNIKKIAKGLRAKITVDAFPDEHLAGEVYRVSVLPDSQNRWMNPDLKVYITFISIDGTHEWVKPGMSAKVEIMVRRLTNTVYVPLQAVSYNAGKQVCYVLRGNSPEERPVEVGEFNEEFIEIKKGLKENELVLLHAPEGAQSEPDQTEKPEDTETPPDAAPGSVVVPARAPAPEGGAAPGVSPQPTGPRRDGPPREGPPRPRERERPSGPREPRPRPT